MLTGARVLCVDDEPIIRMVIGEVLGEIGCEVVEAETGDEALDLLRDGVFDVMVTDIRMHGMSGWDLAERARVTLPGLPIIYVSGYTSENRRLSNTLFLSKPFLPHELRTAVDACVAHQSRAARTKRAAEPGSAAPHDRPR